MWRLERNDTSRQDRISSPEYVHLDIASPRWKIRDVAIYKLNLSVCLSQEYEYEQMREDIEVVLMVFDSAW